MRDQKTVRICVRMTPQEADAYAKAWDEPTWRQFSWTVLIHKALSYFGDAKRTSALPTATELPATNGTLSDNSNLMDDIELRGKRERSQRPRKRIRGKGSKKRSNEKHREKVGAK